MLELQEVSTENNAPTPFFITEIRKMKTRNMSYEQLLIFRELKMEVDERRAGNDLAP